MASFEQRDLIDYSMKKLEDFVHGVSRDYMRVDLDKLWDRARRTEERVRKLTLRVENLENRVRVLEANSSSSELKNKLFFLSFLR